jgi:adenine phosphoribosyltransferase
MYPFFTNSMDLKQIIRTVADFPEPGVKFLDITSILENPEAFRRTVNWLVKLSAIHAVESIVAVDARGFIWAGALANELRIPLHLARKSGKLPGAVVTKHYDTEYSTTSLSMLADTVIKGPVMVIDDIIATGGTMAAVGELLSENWGIAPEQQVHAALISLSFLSGTHKLEQTGYQVRYIDSY